METKIPSRENGTDQEGPFTATEPPELVTSDLLATMRAPDALVEDGIAAFAVAHRTGVVTVAAEALQFEADAVLYLTTDGRAIERYVRRGATTAPRACIVADAQLHDVGVGEPYQDRLTLHPEVA